MTDTADRDLKHSPLDAEHRELGAKMVPFAGWEMPIRYPAGTIAEHMAVRESVGVFDVSHLGSVRVTGKGSAEFLNGLFTNDLRKIAPGRAQYTLLLNDSGGVVDDIIIWWMGEDDFWVIPNASNTTAVVAAMTPPAGIEVEDLSEEMAIIAVQGPAWEKALREAGFEALAPKRFNVTEVDGVVSAGTGYTGERGCELLLDGSAAAEVWRKLIGASVSLGGGAVALGARDTLRLEMGYPLHGNEMDATVTPWEAALGWVVSLDKGDFVGRSAIADGADASKRSLIGVEMLAREIPRSHYAVRLRSDKTGEVTSGNMSPVLGHGIALARVSAGQVVPGDPVEVEIRGEWRQAVCVKPPFVDRG